MAITCLFCDKDVTADEPDYNHSGTLYLCKRCGHVHLSPEDADNFTAERFSEDDKAAISITLRNDWERRGRKPLNKELTLDSLRRIVTQFRPLNPLEKMDHVLLKLEAASSHVAEWVKLPVSYDYPYYFCNHAEELLAILKLLEQEGLITADDYRNPARKLHISLKGYQRLRDIKNPNQDSNQCFVAMWFNNEMEYVYTEAIKPAIEYIEQDQTEPRYHAVKIDNVEHTNDINDEIIAQIRRSRFMVCDLTGYRGGVYFEAGFAYGLGLEVIYTCRKDWTKEEILKDKSGESVKELFDSTGSTIQVKKEGVHFDLDHRVRIEWEPDKLDEFKTKVENRIKAVIV